MVTFLKWPFVNVYLGRHLRLHGGSDGINDYSEIEKFA